MGWQRRLGRDEGQTATEFIAVLAVVALLVAVLAASSIAEVVRDSTGAVTCSVLNNAACGGGALAPVAIDLPGIPAPAAAPADPAPAAEAVPAEAADRSGLSVIWDADLPERHVGDSLIGFAHGLEDQIVDIAVGTVVGVWDLGVWGFRSVTSHEQRVENGALWRQILDDPGAALAAVWDGTTEPVAAEWEAGRPGAAIGRGTAEVLGVFFGGKGLNKLRSLTAGQVGAAARVVQAGGRAWNLDDLATAGTRADRNGLTAAGRAAQKHGAREGNAFPSQTGPAAGINASGQQILEDVLGEAGSSFRAWEHPSYGTVLDVRSPSGRGARFSEDGGLIGFLDPPRPRPR